jgi:hypothetical protein
MDQYSVQFAGTHLDVDQLMSAFDGLKVREYNRRDEDFYVVDGVKKHRKREGNFANASVVFLSDGLELLPFLKIVSEKLSNARCGEIEDTVVWCLMERTGQINGELNVAELGMLNKIDAHFCWSVL